MSTAAASEDRVWRLAWREFAARDDREGLRGVELVDGMLEEGEVTTRKHGRIVTRLVVLFAPWLEATGGGELLTQDNRLKVAVRRVRKPDLLLVRRTDSPVFEDETLVSPPYLVVEVVTNTPRDERRDRVEKLADYEAARCRAYWIIDPATDSLDVYTLGSDGLYGAAKRFEAEARVDGVELGFPGLAFTPRQLGEER